MTNSKHLATCPFYEYEKENFVKCEDVKRIFRNVKKKDDYMRQFCDADWRLCEHAARMQKAYEEGRNMSEVKIKSLISENRKLEKRLKQAEARIRDKDNELKKLQKTSRYYEVHYHMYMDKCVEAQKREKDIAEEVTAMTAMYEARFAYLMAEFAGGILNEKDMEEWSEGKEFAITADKVEDDRVVQWKAIVRLKEDDDTANEGSTE